MHSPGGHGHRGGRRNGDAFDSPLPSHAVVLPAPRWPTSESASRKDESGAARPTENQDPPLLPLTPRRVRGDQRLTRVAPAESLSVVDSADTDMRPVAGAPVTGTSSTVKKISTCRRTIDSRNRTKTSVLSSSRRKTYRSLDAR